MNQLANYKLTQIVDPTPQRKKRLTEIMLRFMQDKISLAELKGMKKSDLYKLAETGFIKMKHGRLDEAHKIFQALILLDHRNAYFHAMMGSVHQKREHVVEAIVEYTQALQINPQDLASLVNRGEIYLRNKNYRKAAEDFKKAILADMHGGNLWANRARSLVIAIKRSLEKDRDSVLKRR